MTKSTIFDTEQSFLSCWGITDDLNLLADVCEGMTPDQRMNAIQGISSLYDLRFNKAWKDLGATFREINLTKIDLKQAKAKLDAVNEGTIWIAGRHIVQTKMGAVWTIESIFDDEQSAKKLCIDRGTEDYFVGPLKVNEILPEHDMDWVGLYWPNIPAATPKV